MKKLFYTSTILLFLVVIAAGCGNTSSTDIWNDYADWRNDNINWLNEQEALEDADGNAVYTRVSPSWNPGIYVLMRWFNDRSLTQGNLSPMLTSTVNVKYAGWLFDSATPFDSSYNVKADGELGDSIFQTKLSSVITGWTVALEAMHVGDSVEVLIPYEAGYGASTSSTTIPPYSALKFNIKLVDIPHYESRP